MSQSMLTEYLRVNSYEDFLSQQEKFFSEMKALVASSKPLMIINIDQCEVDETSGERASPRDVHVHTFHASIGPHLSSTYCPVSVSGLPQVLETIGESYCTVLLGLIDHFFHYFVDGIYSDIKSCENSTSSRAPAALSLMIEMLQRQGRGKKTPEHISGAATATSSASSLVKSSEVDGDPGREQVPVPVPMQQPDVDTESAAASNSALVYHHLVRVVCTACMFTRDRYYTRTHAITHIDKGHDTETQITRMHARWTHDTRTTRDTHRYTIRVYRTEYVCIQAYCTYWI